MGHILFVACSGRTQSLPLISLGVILLCGFTRTLLSAVPALQESWLRSFHSVLESHRGRVDPRVRDKVREAYRVLGFKAGPAAAAGTGSASAQRSPQQVQVPAQQQQEQRRTQPATGGMAGGLRNGAGRKAGAEQRWQQQQQEQREPRARQRDEALSDDPDEWGPPQDAGAGGAAAGGYEGADAVPVLVRPSRFAV